MNEVVQDVIAYAAAGVMRLFMENNKCQYNELIWW